MSTTQEAEPAVITVTVVSSDGDGDGDGAETGHVVLGVLGSFALVLLLVVVIVPVIRWRKRVSSTASNQSRASSRRTHTRIVSEYNQDVAAPLLEEQPPGMTMNDGAGIVSQDKRLTPSRPPAALLNWKILQTLPNFDDESNESSLGNPIEPGERTFPEVESGVRLVDADRRSAALPPIPVSEADEPSRSSTLISKTTPASPLLSAFQASIAPSTSDTISHTNSMSTFRYPSLASSSSKDTNPPVDNATKTHTSSWMPKSLMPGAEGSSPSETWWRIPSMPPIPESVGSGSISSLQHVAADTTKRESPQPQPQPQPTARLRESNASAGPSTVRHVRTSSGEAPTIGTLSRSSTQLTDRSVPSSFVEANERRISTLTHGTFGRQGQSISRQSSSTKLDDTNEVGVGSPVKMEERTSKHVKRRTFDYPREPSPPLSPVPLSAPPPSLRPGYSSSSTRPSSQPIPDPQSPEDPDAELGPIGGPYGHNEEASSSSEHLLPTSDSAPLLPELPSLPQLSPLAFEFRLESAPASRSNSASTGRFSSRRSIRLKGSGSGSKGKAPGHSKTPSKASTASILSSTTGSKRSLRSLASLSSVRTGSSSSRSKSRERERGKHSRRVTFGDESFVPPPVPVPVPVVDAEVDKSRVGVNVVYGTTTTTTAAPRESAPAPLPRKQASRPLPTLPAMKIAEIPIPLAGQVGPGMGMGMGIGTSGAQSQVKPGTGVVHGLP